ncbi:hypothetical protein [Tenacibaculum halocynthiae]|uniref:hypothetical protein n=1 Tax=Tenacibaculum halocynthiae TaxID=1254437 RepID=UPI003D64C015
MKKIILFFVIIITNQLYSQGKRTFWPTNSSEAPKMKVNFNTQTLGGTFQRNDARAFNKNDQFKGVKGSFYLFNTWKNNSTITSKTGKKYQINNMNYDLDEKAFLSKISRDSVYIYQNIESINVENRFFININEQFYEKITDGKISLLKKYSGKLKKPIINKMTNQQVKPAEYVKIVNYYSYIQNKKLEKIKLKKSNISKLITQKKDQVKAYIKKNKLTYKEEGDIVKIINYYNSLF